MFEKLLWVLFPRTLWGIRFRYFERGWDSGCEWGQYAGPESSDSQHSIHSPPEAPGIERLGKILERLQKIAGNPEDAALDVLFTEGGIVCKQDFSRNLKTLLAALSAYHPATSESAPGDG